MNRAERRALAKQVAKGAVTLERPEDRPKPPVISLGYSSGGDVKLLWHQSVLQFIAAASQLGVGVREVPIETGPFLTVARNKILDKMLQHEDEYLLMTDTDIVFRPEHVSLLLEADAAIAGAHYLTAATGEPPRASALVLREAAGEDAEGNAVDPTYEPVSLPELPDPPDPEEFLGEDDGPAWQAAVEMYRAELAEPEYAPRKVAAVGCGLMLIKREVCVAMAEKYDHPFEYIGSTGEDVIFCLRAATLGFDTMLVPQAFVGHIKSVVL